MPYMFLYIYILYKICVLESVFSFILWLAFVNYSYSLRNSLARSSSIETYIHTSLIIGRYKLWLTDFSLISMKVFTAISYWLIVTNDVASSSTFSGSIKAISMCSSCTGILIGLQLPVVRVFLIYINWLFTVESCLFVKVF